jgi:hypothetical protein
LFNTADPASVRGLFTGPLSALVYGASLLIGGIVLLAFYESPLSPLPVPPLPHPPVGRFPPEHSVWPVNRNHRASNPVASNGQPNGNMQFPPIHFPHPAQFVRNPTQYHFAGSNLNPTMVEHPTNRPQPQTSTNSASNAQRRASSSIQSNQGRQPSKSMPHPTATAHFAVNPSLVDSTIDKRTSFNQPPTDVKTGHSLPMETSESINKFVVSGHKPSESMQVNPSLSPVNLLNMVNGNHLLRRSEDSHSAESKQQQLVQAQLNQVQFSSSPALTQLESQLNRS